VKDIQCDHYVGKSNSPHSLMNRCLGNLALYRVWLFP